jgi:3-hydroxyisobutyrate dehydrogenase-like beta-hydroxyacid dehydrogenase
MKLGFLGLGTMGAPIARRFLDAHHDLRVADPARAAIDALVLHGAVAARDAAAAASGAHAVFLSLPGPDEIRTVVTGEDGVLRADPLPRFVVDLSTSSPVVVRELAAECRKSGVVFVDAPVSGGAVKAVSGELSVMVGAPPDAFAEIEPLLHVFATSVFHVGDAGSGTVAKLVNNQLFLGAAVLVQEAYLLAAAHGLAPNELHPIIKASSGGAYAALAPLLLGRRFDDVVFRLDIAAKDLALATEAAGAVGADLPVTRAAAELYASAVEDGFGRLVFHATLQELEQRSGVELPALERRRPA